MIVRLYDLLLSLYPRQFRTDFGEEMKSVFLQAVTDCQNGHPRTFLILREIKDLPGNLLREHWFALTHQEIVMETEIKSPTWVFYILWIALTTIAVPLALAGTFVALTTANRLIGDWITINGQRHITEDYLFIYFFPPAIWLATSLLQYTLLRRHLPKMGGWILVTGLGWVLLFVVVKWIDLFFGHFLGENSNWNPIITVIGVCIGFAQWLLLRRRLPKAVWWILASALGWGAIGLLVGLPFTNFIDITSLGFLPAITTALCWWLLFRHRSQTISAGITETMS